VTSWLDGQLTPENVARLVSFGGIARGLGLEPSQLALARVLHKEGSMSVITGATCPESVTMNLKAAGVELGAEVLTQLSALFPA
jgi:aryl-alcohol dehydrogenase-like predicted oxidoreductase